MDFIKTSYLSFAQIVIDNPIVYDKEETKNKYIKTLNRYLRMGGWNKRKYVSSGVDAYKNIILGNNTVRYNNSIDFYKYYI